MRFLSWSRAREAAITLWCRDRIAGRVRWQVRRPASRQTDEAPNRTDRTGEGRAGERCIGTYLKLIQTSGLDREPRDGIVLVSGAEPGYVSGQEDGVGTPAGGVQSFFPSNKVVTLKSCGALGWCAGGEGGRGNKQRGFQRDGSRVTRSDQDNRWARQGYSIRPENGNLPVLVMRCVEEAVWWRGWEGSSSTAGGSRRPP